MVESFDNKPEKEKRGLFKIIDIIALKYTKLVEVNLLYTICSLPVIVIYMFLAAIICSSLLPANMAHPEMSTTILGVTIAIYLFLMLGGGPVAPGFIYVIRNFARREHAFVLSDFFEHIKKNFKQSIVVFLIDILVMVLLFFNINAVILSPEMFFGFQMPYTVVMLVIVVLYFGARMYLYPLMVTFKASIGTLIKTSFMLCILKLPQNVFFVVLSSVIFYLFQLIPFPLFAFFFVPLVMLSLVEIIRMVYVYGVIEKNIAMDTEEKAENNAENN